MFYVTTLETFDVRYVVYSFGGAVATIVVLGGLEDDAHARDHSGRGSGEQLPLPNVWIWNVVHMKWGT